MEPRFRASHFARLENSETRWGKDGRRSLVGNLQHMAPPRNRRDNPYIGDNSPPPQSLAGKIGERPVSRRALPSQQTLADKQSFLECHTKVLARLSLPNLYDVRRSRSNSELGRNDTDPFHGEEGCIDDRMAVRPTHLSTSSLKHSKTNVAPLRKYHWGAVEDETSESRPSGGINSLPQHRNSGA